MGKVFLVGAGPGDPELLSLKASRLIKEADVILTDNLVFGVKKQIPEGKKIVDVGKTAERHKLSQDEINRLLVELAVSGKYEKVVRLKGGDPFIFGRGSEEALFLKEHGVDFEVVPGISSAVAVPADFGIPLTHRGVSSSVTVVTGHEQEKEEKEEGEEGKGEGGKGEGGGLDWEAVANLRGTLVILMGAGNLARNVGRLLKHGMPAETPVAVLERGFTPDARIVVGELGNIVKLARQARVKPPAVVVVGEVVKVREKLQKSKSQNLVGSQNLQEP